MSSTPLRIHILLIGIDAYALPEHRLTGCVNDVHAFEQLLLKDGLPPFAQAIVHKLLARSGHEPDEHWPTRARIVSELQALASERVAPGDRVIIYYAGHGTRQHFPAAHTDCEALVPVDFAGASEHFLYDFQLRALLLAVVQRCRDLTVILDCCYSAGAPRPTRTPGQPRFITVADAVGAPPAEWRAESHGRAGSAQWAAVPYCVLTACQSSESAVELIAPSAEDTGQMQGLLTQCLLQVLQGPFKLRLEELRWSEVTEPLHAAMWHLHPHQHPLLWGPAWHRVLGGPSEAFDPGLPIQILEDGHLVVAAGVLAGIAVDAQLAVYAAKEPPVLPPLGSEAELRARLAILQVVRVDMSSAAVIISPDTPLRAPLPAGARARLVQLHPKRGAAR